MKVDNNVKARVKLLLGASICGARYAGPGLGDVVSFVVDVLSYLSQMATCHSSYSISFSILNFALMFELQL